ncbi:MAG TPA: hypothetical protein VKB34_10470 [Povalibacter sp.]|nr:hypothetical protein [Povalibacter sp.]
MLKIATSPFREWSRSSSWSPTDTLVIALLIVATTIWAVISGKDLNWDQFNYHFYAAYNLLGGRLDHDFMAANIQSYLNPLAYLPFYWMARHGWPSVLVGCVLAIVHSLNIVLCYLIGKSVAPDDPVRSRVIGLTGAILAFLCPIYLFEAGTSFADITTSVPVLAGILLALRDAPGRRWWSDRALLAGLCIGAAIGLKLSNVIYGPACALLLVCLPASLKRRVMSLVYLALGAVIGFAIMHGYWSWLLWQEFRNPFFPMFNGFFASPDYPAISHQHGRYLPEGLVDVLTLPLRVTRLRSWIYTESVSPDLRLAAFIIVAAAGAWILAAARFRARFAAAWKDFRGVMPLAVCFIGGYAFWQLTSGNGRYGIGILMLCGPVVAALTVAAFGSSRSVRYPVAALTVLIALQVSHLRNGQMHWDVGPWTRTWYETSIPQRLQTEPYLYVSVGSASNSYIAPFLSPDSAFINPVGQLSFDLDGPGGSRMRKLFAEYKGRVRVLAMAPKPDASGHAVITSSWVESANSVLQRLGFEVEPVDCLFMHTAGSQREAGRDFTQPDPHVRELIACPMRERPATAEEVRQREEIHAIFERVAHWCPRLFKPDYTVVEKTPRGWFSAYVDSDTILRIDDDKLLLTQPHTSGGVLLGKPSDWAISVPRDNCDNVPTRLWRIYNFE